MTPRDARSPPIPRDAKGGWTVFLDRDGVLNHEHRWGLRDPAKMTLFPGAAEAVAALVRAGMRVCLVTNQPWVGMGLATPHQIHRVHAALEDRLAAAGGRLDRVDAAYSPVSFARVPLLRGLPGIRRRKPNPGMLVDAAAALAQSGWYVDPARAVMVGDSARDIEAAARFGIPGIAVCSKHDAAWWTTGPGARTRPAAVVADLAGAAAWILAESKR